MSIPSSTILEKEESFAQVFEGSSEHDWTPLWKFRAEENVPSYDAENLESQTGTIVYRTVHNTSRDYGVVDSPWTNNRKRKCVNFVTSPDRIVIKSDRLDIHAQDILRILSRSILSEPRIAAQPIFPQLPRQQLSRTWDIGKLSFDAFLHDDGRTDLPYLTSQTRMLQAHKAIDRAFNSAQGEFFDDGMESPFSNAIHSVVHQYGHDAVMRIESLISSQSLNPEVKSEALKQLGLVEHKPSHLARLSVLTKHLASDSMRIRDSASLGIAALDDPSAIEALRRALNAESSPLLRSNFQLVIDRLKDKKHVAITQGD